MATILRGLCRAYPRRYLNGCRLWLNKSKREVEKPEFAGHITVTILEGEDAGFVDLDGEAFTRLADCMVDIRLFARTDTTLQRIVETASSQTKQDNACSAIENLLYGGPVGAITITSSGFFAGRVEMELDLTFTGTQRLL